jgi:hypothetical protein
VEIARDYRIDEPHFWNLELIPIVGLRLERWHFAANPGIERPLSGRERAAQATPAAKLAYRTLGRNDFGLEHYKDEHSRTLYFAWDGKLGRSDLNVGLGRGSTPSERWVLKTIYEIAF